MSHPEKDAYTAYCHEMYDNSFEPIDSVAEFSLRSCFFKDDPDLAKPILLGYYKGTRFSHADAYLMCGMIKKWPDFCLHPSDKSFVLSFSKVNTSFGDREVANLFESWVKENGQEIAIEVAETLSIDWNEVEQLNKSLR